MLVEAASPPSEAQLGLWIGHQRAADPTIYLAAEAVWLRGPLDESRFVRALEAVHEAADGLQICFVESGGAVRIEHRPRPLALERLDLRDQPASSWDAHVLRTRTRVPSLSDGPLSWHTLARLSEDRHVWLHVAHHIALDGYGFDLFARSVAAHYRAGVEPEFDSIREVLRADAAYTGSGDQGRDQGFWMRELAGSPGLSLGSGDILGPGVERSCALDPSAFSALRAEARRYGASWMELGLARAAETVGALTGQRRFALSVPFMARIGTAAARVPCMAMNMLGMPVDLDETPETESLLAALRAASRRQAGRRRFRYERLGQRLGPVVNILPFGGSPDFGPAEARRERVSVGPVGDLALTLATQGAGLEVTVASGDPSRDPDDTRWWAERWAASLFAPVAGTHRGQRRPRGFFHRFEQQVKLQPAAPALMFGPRRWTYAELDERVRASSAFLLEHGVGPGSLLAVALPRGPEAIIAVLAAHRVGAAWVGTDLDQPSEHRQAVLRAARPDRVLVAPGGSGLVFEPSELPAASSPPRTEPAIAYLTFTSGSTGTPKGVVTSGRALDAFVEAASSRYGFRRDDRILQFASLAFDASVEEIFVGLAAGSCLVLREEGLLERGIEGLLAFCADRAVTVLDLPTALFHELAQHRVRYVAPLPAALRLVVVGGEALSAASVASWPAAVTLLNTYGPSEATVVATSAVVRSGASEVPIGRPLPGVEAVLLDPEGNPLDGPGEGELGLGGATLAEGYLGDQTATEAKFFRLDGRRLYRSGDRVRRDEHGQLWFLGRTDRQLKISGHRVEPEGIEAELLGFPGVTAARVWGEGHPLRLEAVVEASSTSEDELRRYLKGRLPAPLRPARIRVASRLERTVGGKVKQPAPEAPPDGGTAPQGVEARVRWAWRSVLGHVPAGDDVDFFSVGGSSLQVLQLAARLDAPGRPVRPTELFEHPTVSAQVRLLRGGEASVGFEPRPIRLRWRSAERVGQGSLLTGATGFVGAFLLSELSRSRPEESVGCVVRARDLEHARERLQSAVRTHGVAVDWDRVELLPVDLEGLDGARARAEWAPRARIFHCAARVSLTRSYASLFEANVASTATLLELASSWGARFQLCSSVAVIPYGQTREAFVPVHEGLRDGYQRSKWHAEALVERAVRAGLDASVVRLPRVVSDGRSPGNPEDLVQGILRASRRVGCWPRLSIEEPWLPVDVAARALDALVEREGPVFHALPAGRTALDAVRQAAAPELEEVAFERWRERVEAEGDDRDRALLGFFDARGAASWEEPIIAPKWDRSAAVRACPELEAVHLTPAQLTRMFPPGERPR